MPKRDFCSQGYGLIGLPLSFRRSNTSVFPDLRIEIDLDSMRCLCTVLGLGILLLGAARADLTHSLAEGDDPTSLLQRGAEAVHSRQVRQVVLMAGDPPQSLPAQLGHMRPALWAVSCVTVLYFAAYAVLAIIHAFNQAQDAGPGPVEKALESAVMGVCFAPMLCVLFLSFFAVRACVGWTLAMTESDLKAVSDSFEGLEGMNLPVAAFVEAFKTNPVLQSIFLGCSTKAQWDSEGSGNLSFENFVQGLSKMRQFNRSATEQAEVAEEQAVLDASVQEAKEAFLAAGGGQGSELDLQAFLVALSDATLVDKIATATGLPTSFFESLSVRQLLDLFKEVDTRLLWCIQDLDCSGTISLEEWIEALVRIRMTIYDERKAEMDAAMDAVRTHAEAALNEGDEDWSGEFDFREFIVAFKHNPTFLRKVSLATGISVEELGSMQDESIEDLFLALDTDFSGTVSFAEFGGLELAMAHGLPHLRTAWQVEKAVTEEESRVVLLRFGHDYDPECKLTDDVLLALSDTVKDHCPQSVYSRSRRIRVIPSRQRLDRGSTRPLIGVPLLKLGASQHPEAEYRAGDRGLSSEAGPGALGPRQKDEAFETADFDLRGELDLQSFMQALGNTKVAEKVSQATSVPTEWMVELFQDIDADANGKVSFHEWILALLRVRQANHEDLKAERQQETGLFDGEMAAIESLVEEALEEGDEDWSGELDFREFIAAFRCNPRFVRKDLEQFFAVLDTDRSGTISFDEFVNGLLDIRLKRHAYAREQAEAENQAADLGVTGELDLDSFHKALQQPAILEKVAVASQLPPEFFTKLSKQDIRDMFARMDTDCSGGISFNEWEVYLTEKLEQETAIAAVMGDAAAAMDEVLEEESDWTGEFELQRFISAFQTNSAFLQKVSHATGLPVDEYQRLQASDLKDLFDALDMDFSGTVSFSEFVEGLAAIRRAHEAAILEEVPSPSGASRKDAMVQGAPEGMDSITPSGLKQLMSLLDADRWTPAKLEKLIAGLPWTNGTLPLSKLVDLLY
eukprot:s1975_g13.t1